MGSLDRPDFRPGPIQHPPRFWPLHRREELSSPHSLIDEAAAAARHREGPGIPSSAHLRGRQRVREVEAAPVQRLLDVARRGPAARGHVRGPDGLLYLHVVVAARISPAAAAARSRRFARLAAHVTRTRAGPPKDLLTESWHLTSAPGGSNRLPGDESSVVGSLSRPVELLVDIVAPSIELRPRSVPRVTIDTTSLPAAPASRPAARQRPLAQQPSRNVVADELYLRLWSWSWCEASSAGTAPH